MTGLVAPTKELTPDEQLCLTLGEFFDDPLGYVMFAFPWDTNENIQQVELVEPWKSRFPNCKYGPDKWQCEFLDQWGEEIRKRGFDGKRSVPPIQFTTASGHGIGKSCLVAWIVKFILDTRPMSVGTVTANTAEQLKTKTWAEIGKWHKISVTAHWFEYTTGRGAMSLYHKSDDFKEQWKCSAVTCREENSEAFAGQHAAGGTSFYIFDEASAIPDKIFDVREGGTTDGEPMTFDFGNPTRNSGRFHANCIGKFKHNYIFRQIDSRTVQLPNKERIQQWIDDYGLDSDFIKVRVLGQFPSLGSVQFIGSADVNAAVKRELVSNRHAAVIIGVDVARFGDDHSCIWPRIGTDARSFPPEKHQGLDGVQLAMKIIEKIKMFQALGFALEDIHVFIDGTGGYGGSPADHLRHNGWPAIEINFAGGVADKAKYRYRGDEMWGRMRDSIRTDLCLPGVEEPITSEIVTELTQREYGFTLQGNKIHLETKKDMKARGVPSPDIADALALTYAMDVAPRIGMTAGAVSQSLGQTVGGGEYNPHAS